MDACLGACLHDSVSRGGACYVDEEDLASWADGRRRLRDETGSTTFVLRAQLLSLASLFHSLTSSSALVLPRLLGFFSSFSSLCRFSCICTFLSLYRSIHVSVFPLSVSASVCSSVRLSVCLPDTIATCLDWYLETMMLFFLLSKVFLC